MESDLKQNVNNSSKSSYADTEIVIGLVGAVGTPHNQVIRIIKERLDAFRYSTSEIRVSNDVISKIFKDIPKVFAPEQEYERITEYIEKGNKARRVSGENSILALGAATEIFSKRDKDEQNGVKPKSRTAYIINSLKHPAEVTQLRAIYQDSFYLIGIHSDEDRRIDYLTRNKSIESDKAHKLIERDEDEVEGHGQHTRDTFHLADFFIHLDSNTDKLEASLWRIIDLIFQSPYITPVFDEYAMFMAFASALRSADLSRQIGAVIARDKEIIATGANDCPKANGGLYWPEYDQNNHKYIDAQNGRDYTRKCDSNKKEQKNMIEGVLSDIEDLNDREKVEKALWKSQIKDITEYGRPVHAEMEALLFCARNTVYTRGATLYTTTFPCHNCAKHIIAAGITKVVYVEPYPKSKAFKFHNDAITTEEKPNSDMVAFVPFVGIGPRKFFDLFSMNLSSGFKLRRKNEEGDILCWNPKQSCARIQMLPWSYLDQETKATEIFEEYKEKLESKNE